jgi:hypothetical protein
MSWIAGYTFVGNGTNGAVNAVLFQTATSTYILKLRVPVHPGSSLLLALMHNWEPPTSMTLRNIMRER